jgi:DNA-binding CsgD family transcriptional regulator
VLEAEYPFGVARQLLESPAVDARRRAAMLAAAGGLARPVLECEALPVGAPDATFAVLRGLFWALANLAADGPLLVCVDDAQWADEPSLRWLDFLARRLDELPVELLVAWRVGEGAAVRGVMRELEGGPLVGLLEPAPLSEGAVLELARAMFGEHVEPLFGAACYERTGGNPFFVAELTRELLAEGVEPTASGAEQVAELVPPGVGRVVLARLARLGADASALARAVSLLGDGAELADAAELACLSRAAAVEAVRALAAAGILRDDQRLGIAHPLMRDAIEADITPSARASEHATAARVLAVHGRTTDQVAAHVLLGPASGDAWAVERLREAARAAVQRGAPDAALPLLRRALAEPPPPIARTQVLLELGAAEDALQRPEAIEHLVAARDAMPRGSERGRVAMVLAHALAMAGRSREVYETVRDGQAGLTAGDRELSLALEAIALNAGSFDPDGRRLTESRLSELAALEGATPSERAVLACIAFEFVKASHPVAEVIDLVERALGTGPWSYAWAADPLVPLILASALHACGRISRAVELCSVLIDEARALGSAALFAEASTARALARWRGGSLGEAEADARQALELVGVAYGQMHLLATATLVGVLTDRGDFDAALALAEAFRPPVRDRAAALVAVVECALGQLEVALGRYEKARTRLAAAGKTLDAVRCTNPAGGEWRQPLAFALGALGRRPEAHEVLAPAVVAARRSREPYELGVTLRTAALIENPVGVELLREAQAVLEASEIRLQHARVLIDLGAALRRQGYRRDARDPLAQGIDLAQRCHAAPLVDRARTELLAAGARPRRVERTGADALTPSERRVATLARDGLSNREIAQQLFVSPRTVEAQLRAAYAKLSVVSRRELADALD